jgi:endogenous inhibitor of DNA gyrase (YacG/DUF329 family)
MVIQRAGTATVELKCKSCGRLFEAPRKRRGRHRGFCCDECEAAAIKERAERYRAEGRYVRTFLCAVCGKHFQTAASTQTCSPEHAAILQGWNVSGAAKKRKAVGDLFAGLYPAVETEGET